MFDRLLDLSVLFSFDRSGYLRHKHKFAKESLRPGNNLRALITGGTSGIGLALARELLSLNISVHITSRNERKAFNALETLKREFPQSSLQYHSFDIGNFKEFPLFSDTFDIVVHNAGGMPRDKIGATDLYESIFATHVIGPYSLTRSLIDREKLSSHGRVIFVSSGGMYLKALSLDDLNFSKRSYNPYIAYANAKRAQVDLTSLFARYYGDYLFSSMHPGWVDTPGIRDYMPAFSKLLSRRLRSPQEGADTILWLAMTATPYPSGRFWFDRKEVPSSIIPCTATETDMKEALFNFCEEEYRKRGNTNRNK